MMKRVMSKKNLISSLCCASAAGLLLGSASTYAAGSNQQYQSSSTDTQSNTENAATQEFSAADKNRDQGLVWTEIYAIYEPELQDAGWDETAVLNEFDANQDNQLNMDEYVVFISGLANESSQRRAASNQSTAQPSADSQQQNRTPQEQQDLSVSATQNPDQHGTSSAKQIPSSTSGNQQSSTATTGGASRNAQGDGNQSLSQAADNQQASSAAAGEASAANDLTVADIKDLPVQNMNGQELGEVKDVVLRQDGAEAGLVVTLKAGSEDEAKDIFVSLDQLGATEDYVVWLTPLNKEEVQNLPEYNDALYLSIE